MGFMDGMILKLLADRLEKQGFDWIEIKAVRFSKSDHRFELDVQLAGEEIALPVAVDYEVVGEELRVTRLVTGKRWITEVLQLLVASKGGVFPLPAGMKGSLVKMLI